MNAKETKTENAETKHRSQKIKLVKKLKNLKTSQQLNSSYLIMLSPFLFFFFSGSERY